MYSVSSQEARSSITACHGKGLTDKEKGRKPARLPFLATLNIFHSPSTVSQHFWSLDLFTAAISEMVLGRWGGEVCVCLK